MKSRKGEIRHVAVGAVLLFILWVLLSEIFTVKFITYGILSSFFAAWVARGLYRLPAVGGKGYFWALDFCFVDYIKYSFWLLGQIIVANVEVAMIILNPRLPIDPGVFTFTKPMENPLAHVVLGNSITLTPGTVTMDVNRGEYTVHALTAHARHGLVTEEGLGPMPEKVGQLFPDYRMVYNETQEKE